MHQKALKKFQSLLPNTFSHHNSPNEGNPHPPPHPRCAPSNPRLAPPPPSKPTTIDHSPNIKCTCKHLEGFGEKEIGWSQKICILGKL